MAEPTLRPGPVVLVIFGAGGDLSWRKLIPAIYNLFLDKWLPDEFAIIGVDRREMNLEEFHDHLLDGVNRFSRRGKADPTTWSDFTSHLAAYFSADLSDPAMFNALKGMLLISTKYGTVEQIMYSISPYRQRSSRLSQSSLGRLVLRVSVTGSGLLSKNLSDGILSLLKN